MQALSLDGQWHLTQPDRGLSMRARVPGCVHADLLAAKKIPDLFYRDNERKLLWIGESEWRYQRAVDVPREFLEHECVKLRCHGLDTLAAVFLNGTEIGRTDNMFRTWEFDVRHLLVPGENVIEVRFSSPLPVMEERQRERRIPSWGRSLEPDGRAWIRKEPCNFGWDWGPVVVTCGIWKSIELVAFNTARLGALDIVQHHQPGVVELSILPETEVFDDTPLAANITVTFGENVVGVQTWTPGGGRAVMRIDNPRLWWPNGMGPHPLYTVRAELKDDKGNVLDTTSRRIGLRTLRLGRHPDAWGETFQFEANGIPFFAKGGNWIPADAIVTRMTADRYRHLLNSVVTANMNMLRVWGGGIYENDVFYDLCDELGICIWHDFMFACSTYPTFDDTFMANVREEIFQQVRRLRHHPAIALWCGNNELEQGLVGPEWTKHQMSWTDYGRLFDELIPEILRATDPERPYWPCSPHTPVGDRKDFNSPRSGDAHLWNVWHGRQPFEWYRTCEHRFNSEFGFQSFPEPCAVNSFTLPEDRNVSSYVMELHQRSGIGNDTIIQYMLSWFRMPATFDMTLRLSQILQGMAMKYAVEHWRRSMPRGMGTLYWQINDCWPAASWSSIDCHGRWKALHYMARHFYEPLLVSTVEDIEKGSVDVHVTSDLLADMPCELCWQVTTASGALLAAACHPLVAPSRKNTLVETLSFADLLKTHGARNLIFWADLLVEGRRVSSNLATFSRPKHMELQNPGIKARVTQSGQRDFTVTLTARAPALWTWLELKDGDATFSDNYFHIAPDRERRVTVRPLARLSETEFRRALRVRSLVDTYTAGK